QARGDGAEAEHGGARKEFRGEGEPPGRCRADGQGAQANGAGGSARDRLPLGRPIRRGSDAPPVPAECDRVPALAADLLLWAGTAGGGAQGVGRPARECGGGAGRLRPSSADERARGKRQMERVARKGGMNAATEEPNCRLFLVAPSAGDVESLAGCLEAALASGERGYR